MKIITQYQCEICGERYNDAQVAVRCEARGPANLDKWKPGLLWRYKWDKEKGGIFALAKVRISSYSRHRVNGSFWACRNWSTSLEGGDNLGDEGYCSGPELKNDFNSGITAADLELPEMKRMLSYLESVGIEPYVMVNGHSHPLTFVSEK